MEEVILFLLSFVFIFLLYQIIIIGPAKRSKSLKTRGKRKDKNPIEVKYLISKYKLDMEKVNYNQLLQIVAITSSFDIALIGSLIMAVEDFFLSVVVGIVAIVVLIMGSYHLVYLFYKKKGMVKNG